MSESCNDLAGSEDHRNMLLPNHAKEIEQKLEDNSGSTRTQIDLKSNSTRIETLLARPIFGLRNASSTYQQMIKSIYSAYGASLDYLSYVKNSLTTASREAPIFDVYSDSDESSSDDNLDLIIDALTQLQVKSRSARTPTELLDHL